MMDLDLFASLLKNLLHTEVLALPLRLDRDALQAFEDSFCYNTLLQPLFTSENLARLLVDVEDKVLYELKDELGVCLLFFQFAFQQDARYFVVGPFVHREYSEEKIRSTLMRNGLSAAVAQSVKLYYSALPLVSFTHARNTVIACIQSFSGVGEGYTVCQIDDTLWRENAPQRGYDQILDYSSVYRRYDVENRYLRLIQEGDTERVLIAYNEMTLLGMGSKQYINALYQDPIIALSMVRALSRKAAEQGGASVIEINEITQRAARDLVAARTTEEQTKVTKAMVLELTQAVRRKRERSDKYSLPIQRVVGYLQLNFSQSVSLGQLAELAHFSETYLSRQFKKETKLTITDYVARLRCDEAARLLRESDTTVQEIGAYVGYADNNYFSKVFRHWYGVSPSQYRAGKRAPEQKEGKQIL